MTMNNRKERLFYILIIFNSVFMIVTLFMSIFKENWTFLISAILFLSAVVNIEICKLYHEFDQLKREMLLEKMNIHYRLVALETEIKNNER